MCTPVGATCYSWIGFMQMAVKGSKHDLNIIDILPGLHSTRHNLFSTKLCTDIVCEAATWYSASEIVDSSFDLDRVVIRPGGLHLIMLYMGVILCAVMRGSGIVGSSASLVTDMLNTSGYLGLSLNCPRALNVTERAV